KWNKQDYDEILRRIKEEVRTSKDVCRDIDVPTYITWLSYRNEHPDYNRRYKDIMETMPFSLQRQCHGLGERLKEEVLKLYEEGLSQKQIAYKLELSKGTIHI